MTRGAQPTCGECTSRIVGKYMRYTPDGADENEVTLHEDCFDRWLKKKAPQCDWCEATLLGEYKVLSNDEVEVLACVNCADGIISGGIRGCAWCRKMIRSGSEAELVAPDGTCIVLHKACEEAYIASNTIALPCAHCDSLMANSIIEISDPHSYGTVRLHPECVMPFKKANAPMCCTCSCRIVESGYTLMGRKAYHDSCLNVSAE
ncbi:hypothetical protein DIPPA_57656 [Diplonema papillatum]|nr:hypothetical protein DIPPA_57656 [Diplonema papillatum]